MNTFKTTYTTLGLAMAGLLVSSSVFGQIYPNPPSENSVAVDVYAEDQSFLCGEVGGVEAANCSAGLVSVNFSAFAEDTVRYCSPLSDQSVYPSAEGIICQIDQNGTVSWSLVPVSAPGQEVIVPNSISSVIVSQCQFGYESERPDRARAYTYFYGPVGVGKDTDLKLFSDGDGFFQINPYDVTFCYPDPDEVTENPALSAAPPIPVCETASSFDDAAGTTEKVIFEPKVLRSDDGTVQQPPSMPNEQTCVVTPDDEPLTQCDPSAGEGDPNACRDPSSGGPGQVTRIDQWNGDPYFCRTLNGIRTCWAY